MTEYISMRTPLVHWPDVTQLQELHADTVLLNGLKTKIGHHLITPFHPTTIFLGLTEDYANDVICLILWDVEEAYPCIEAIHLNTLRHVYRSPDIASDMGYILSPNRDENFVIDKEVSVAVDRELKYRALPRVF